MKKNLQQQQDKQAGAAIAAPEKAVYAARVSRKTMNPRLLWARIDGFDGDVLTTVRNNAFYRNSERLNVEKRDGMWFDVAPKTNGNLRGGQE